MTTTALITKRFALVWLALGLLAGLVLATTFGGTTAKADVHTGVESVSLDKVVVDLVPGTSRSKEELFIRGGGFTPGTDLFVLVEDSRGVLTEISQPASNRRDGGGHVKALASNDRGAWATSWRLGRFSRNNIGGEAMGTIWVVDHSFNNLATAPIAICDVSGREDYLADNGDATEVALHNLAAAALDALADDPSASVGYTTTDFLATDAYNEVFDGGGILSRGQLDEMADAKTSNAGYAAFAHVDDLDAVTVKLVAIPSWCSDSYIPSKGGGF